MLLNLLLNLNFNKIILKIKTVPTVILVVNGNAVDGFTGIPN